MPLLTLFIFAFLGAGLALLLELLTASFFVNPGLAFTATFTPGPFSLLLFAAIEEGVKLLLFLKAKHRLTTLPHFTLSGLSFGAGFASLEYFILSFLDTLPTGPVYGIFLVHVALSILMAWFLTKSPSRRGLLLLFLALTILHFGYNMWL